MKTRAAVAFEAKTPLEIVELDLAGPKAGEVLVEIMATGICHTDAYTLDGLDSEGLFPSVLGHEGAGVVREVGAFMAEDRGEDAFAVEAVERVGVGMADAGRHDLDQHLAGLRALEIELDDLELLPGGEGDGGTGLHGSCSR